MVVISPAGLDTTALVANQLSCLATYTEKLCRSYCVNSSVQPQYSVTYVTGTPTLNNESVFVPVSAVITIVTPSTSCGATTQLFTEEFTVAFQGQTALPSSVTITSVGRLAKGSNVKCCKASAYTIADSIEILIA